MRAFLSHSSKDKGLIEEVAEGLGAANCELDSFTFDRGLLTVDAIQQALNRALLFVLFLSTDAVKSPIVRFETSMARELQARGLIDRLLVVCLDDESFRAVDEPLRAYNFVRKAVSTQAITRLIQNALIVARTKGQSIAQPFVGRSSEVHRAKERLIDPVARSITAIYVSGNAGIGRRTFARKLFGDVYPAINPIFPEIAIDPLDGYEELYRKISEAVAPMSTLSAWRARIAAFAMEKPEGKPALIAALLGNLLEAREAIVVRDQGGLLEDAGSIQPSLRKVLESCPLSRIRQ